MEPVRQLTGPTNAEEKTIWLVSKPLDKEADARAFSKSMKIENRKTGLLLPES